MAELLDAVEGEVEAHANSRELSYPDWVSFVATSDQERTPPTTPAHTHRTGAPYRVTNNHQTAHPVSSRPVAVALKAA